MNCKCGKPSNPKSTKGYCGDCMKDARKAWVAMIGAKSAERTDRDAAFTLLIEQAHAAGEAAALSAKVIPMTVVGGGKSYYVPEGVCGFAWVTVHPGNCALSNYLKKHHKARAAYGGGMQVWISQYYQSMQLKESYAYAYAKVLQDAGHTAYAGSRMD